MTSKEIAKLAIKALEDKKGENIKIVDISNVSIIADYFIIADGDNVRKVQAMANNVDEELGKNGVFVKSTEGFNSANWILMDYGDIIVHIFDKESRSYYDLERIWRDCAITDSKDFE